MNSSQNIGLKSNEKIILMFTDRFFLGYKILFNHRKSNLGQFHFFPIFFQYRDAVFFKQNDILMLKRACTIVPFWRTGYLSISECRGIYHVPKLFSVRRMAVK